MKRTISSVLCIAILITCLALSLSSCAKLEISTINRLQGKDRAAAVLLRMSLAIGKAGSYTTDSVSDLSVTLTNEKSSPSTPSSPTRSYLTVRTRRRVTVK